MGDIVAGSGPEYKYVVCNAELRCLFGEETFVMESGGINSYISERPQLTVTDTEIATFKNCFSPFNPKVVEATIAMKPDGQQLIEKAISDVLAAITSAVDSGIAGKVAEYKELGLDKLEKVPCEPDIPMPWINGHSDKNIGGAEVLLDVSANMCMYCGEIIVINDGQ